MITFLGFDPGQSGGCAMIDQMGAQAVPMPVAGGAVDAHALGVWVYSIVMTATHAPVIAAVEAVHAMPKQGVSSTFKFGRNYGTILGVLGALGVRTELVTPQAWKAVVLAGTTKDKDAAIAWCRRAYPRVELIQKGCRTPHDGCADALCIAEWGRRAIGSSAVASR